MSSPDLIAGRYRIISQLGEGGMGVAYRAWDNERDVPVVVKMPKADKESDSDFIERFNREIKAMAGMTHPHIVPVVGFGQDIDGRPYVAMRFLPGGSLSDRRRRGPDKQTLPSHPSLLHQWLPSISDALDVVHRAGLVHRDVKPDNIFFDARWNAFLGDFGVAKVVNAVAAFPKDETITKTGIAVGTYAYMAPEVWSNKPVAASDQYSLAVAVYEMLAGMRPFTGEFGELARGHIIDPPPPLLEKQPHLPSRLCEAVHRALAKKPEDRFGTCVDFAAAVLEGVPAPLRREGVTRVMCPACRVMCSTSVKVAADLESVWLLGESQAAAGQGDHKPPKTPSTFGRSLTGSFKSVALTDIVVHPSVIGLVPERVARELRIFPVKVENGSLQLAIGDPVDGEPHERVRFAFPDRDIEFVYAPDWEIAEAIKRRYEKPASEKSDSGAKASQKPQAATQPAASKALTPPSPSWLQPPPPHSSRRWRYFAAFAVFLYLLVSLTLSIVSVPASSGYMGLIISGCILISILLALPTASLLVYLENGPPPLSQLRPLGMPSSADATKCEQLFRECRFTEAALLLEKLAEGGHSKEIRSLLEDARRLGVLREAIMDAKPDTVDGSLKLRSAQGKQLLEDYKVLLQKRGLVDALLSGALFSAACAPLVAIAMGIFFLYQLGRIVWAMAHGVGLV